MEKIMSKQSTKHDSTSDAESLKRHPVREGASAVQADPTRPREGSKSLRLVEMLSMPNGASIVELMNATGWLAHTTRAAVTGLRKRGFAVLREPDGAGTSRYRIEVAHVESRSKRRKGAGEKQKTSPAVA